MPITIKNAPKLTAGELEALKAQVVMIDPQRLAANGGKASFHAGGRTITGTLVITGPGDRTYTVEGGAPPAAKAKNAPKKKAAAKKAAKAKPAPKKAAKRK